MRDYMIANNPPLSREDMAREFLNSMLRGPARADFFIVEPTPEQLVTFAFGLADAVIAERSPRSPRPTT